MVKSLFPGIAGAMIFSPFRA